MRVGSLFSGIGGLELGLERAGMTVVWQVEKDEYCRKVLAKHWPDVTRYEDVHDVGAHNLKPVDLACGGFPCQPVSQAGKRRAQDDERWLWPEFARIIRELRPRYVLLENVPGLLVRGFGDVLGELSALGYDAEWESLPASAFGAPHLRYRVFVVAYANGERGRAPEVLRPECEGAAELGNDGQPRPVSYAACERRRAGRSRRLASVDSRLSHAAGALADTNGGRCEGERKQEPRGIESPCGREPDRCGQFRGVRNAAVGENWTTEPDVGRVADGVPSRVDRLRALGNAVVPQVAEWIGHRIMEHSTAQRRGS